MSKRIILYLMAVWVFTSIYYQEYKREKLLLATPTLNNVSVRAINGTDPIRVDDEDTVRVVSKIYEGLYSYHYLKRPLELVPNLAEAMPSISPDGLVYTFSIKKGVLFQDDACFPDGKGREMKAADFVFTLKRIVDPTHTVPYVDFINGKIKGLDGWKQQQPLDYAQEVEGLKALDDYTLQVTLTAPWPNFLHFLAMWPAFVVAQEAVLHYGPEFLNHPVGTGPFILQGGFDPQAKQLTFLKNPTFREKYFPTEADPQCTAMLAYASKKLPLVDKVVTDIITEEQPRWFKMKRANVDMDKIDDAAIGLKIVKEGVLLPKYVKKGLVLHQVSGPNTEFFAFNHNHELFKNTYLRQAMSMAFDRETYNQMFYKQAAEVAQSLVPPMLISGTDPLANPYGYNLERAKEYLVKAGYPDGKGLPVITLDTRSETTYKNKAEFFAKCMANIGIEVQVITNVWSELYNKMMKYATMMYAFGWLADYPESSSMLEVISSKHLCGLGYENTTFNTLFRKAVATANHAERQLLYAELNKMAAEEVPIICAVHRPIQILYHNWVKNVVYNGFDLSLDQYIAVDMQAKVKAAR